MIHVNDFGGELVDSIEIISELVDTIQTQGLRSFAILEIRFQSLHHV